MPTTHTRNGAGLQSSSKSVYIYDQAGFTDGQPFAPGNTLVVNSGEPSIASVNGAVAPMTTGTYDFAPTAGGDADLHTDNIALDAASIMAESGPGHMQWFLDDQFANNGAIQVGSASASGSVSALNTSSASLTNQGSITVRNNSTFRMQPVYNTDALVNNAGGLISINSGSFLYLSTLGGLGGGGAVNTTNNGVIEINGASGVQTSAD